MRAEGKLFEIDFKKDGDGRAYAGGANRSTVVERLSYTAVPMCAWGFIDGSIELSSVKSRLHIWLKCVSVGLIQTENFCQNLTEVEQPSKEIINIQSRASLSLITKLNDQ